jgi:hypothetical protein
MSDLKLREALFPIGTVLIGFGVVVLGWQVYGYLRFGVWPQVSVITLLGWLNVPWANYPTDWRGVHILLMKTPLFVVLFLFGAFSIRQSY